MATIYIFPNFQNCARCEKDLKDNKDNSRHLGRNYASPSENCELRGTDNVQGQISKDKYPSIFSPQIEPIVLIILRIFFATRAVLKIGEYINNSRHLTRKYLTIILRNRAEYRLIMILSRQGRKSDDIPRD